MIQRNLFRSSNKTSLPFEADIRDTGAVIENNDQSSVHMKGIYELFVLVIQGRNFDTKEFKAFITPAFYSNLLRAGY